MSLVKFVILRYKIALHAFNYLPLLMFNVTHVMLEFIYKQISLVA